MLTWQKLPLMPACGVGMICVAYADEEWIDLTDLGGNKHIDRSLAQMALRPTRINLGCRVMSCVETRHVYVARKWFGHLFAGIKTANNTLLRLVADASAIAEGLESDLLRRRAGEIRKQLLAREAREQAARIAQKKAADDRATFLKTLSAYPKIKPLLKTNQGVHCVPVNPHGTTPQEEALNGLIDLMPELEQIWRGQTGLGVKSMRNTLSGQSKVRADEEAYRETGFQGLDLPGRVKLTDRKIQEIKSGHASGQTLGMLAGRYNTTEEVIRKILSGHYKTKATRKGDAR